MTPLFCFFFSFRLIDALLDTIVQRELVTGFHIHAQLVSTEIFQPQYLCRTAVCVSLVIFAMNLVWEIQKSVQRQVKYFHEMVTIPYANNYYSCWLNREIICFKKIIVSNLRKRVHIQYVVVQLTSLSNQPLGENYSSCVCISCIICGKKYGHQRSCNVNLIPFLICTKR